MFIIKTGDVNVSLAPTRVSTEAGLYMHVFKVADLTSLTDPTFQKRSKKRKRSTKGELAPSVGPDWDLIGSPGGLRQFHRSCMGPRARSLRQRGKPIGAPSGPCQRSRTTMERLSESSGTFGYVSGVRGSPMGCFSFRPEPNKGAQ
ncbi:hypothetical protein SAY86_018301 [Trapa natans]|uniref:Uncharacterized protein n=1 Tax=Trapa natans TaxID=22666 RepID=A0AAN7R305_TRANT|nr:hypothetical protein SAY86_018301 [Trapa natans]